MYYNLNSSSTDYFLTHHTLNKLYNYITFYNLASGCYMIINNVQCSYIFSVSKHSLIYTHKSTLIFLTLTKILSKVLSHVKMQKKQHKVISSLNKCSTENVLNWSPSCFVTAAVLPDISLTAKLETTFRRLSRVA